MKRPTSIELAELVYIDLKKSLESYGNKLSTDHERGLMETCQGYGDMLVDGEKGRWAFPLPTGTGKTTSVLSLIKIIHQEDLPFSIAVCAEKVEALCEINRSLVAMGVPESKIGLIHSYNLWDGDKDHVPAGMASEPATPESDINHKQFLLVTHNKVKSNSDISKYFVYKGEKRSILIWDETLWRSSHNSVSFKTIDEEIALFFRTVERKEIESSKGISKDVYELRDYLKAIEKELKHAHQKLCSDSEATVTIRIPEPKLPDWGITRLLKIMRGNSQATLQLRKLIENRMQPIRMVATNQGPVLIQYEVVIPDELDRIIILDASYPIRHACKLNKTIHQIAAPLCLDYSGLSVNYCAVAAGRNKIESAFMSGWNNKFALEVTQLVNRIRTNHPDDKVLIFMHKDGTDGQGHTILIRKKLEEALKRGGIDLEVADRGHIHFQTYGQETSSNQFSECKHVILAGMYYLPEYALSGLAIGESDDLLKDLSLDLLKEVNRGEQLHTVYQAASRGNIRRIQEGIAGKMDLYLWCTDPLKLKDGFEVNDVLTGAVWAPYEPVYLDHMPNRTLEIKHQVIEVLRTRTSDISNRELINRVAPELSGKRNTAWKNAVKKVKADIDSGRLEGWTYNSTNFLTVGTDEQIKAA